MRSVRSRWRRGGAIATLAPYEGDWAVPYTRFRRQWSWRRSERASGDVSCRRAPLLQYGFHRGCTLSHLLASVDSCVMSLPMSQLRLFSRHKGEITNLEEWRDKREAVNSGWVPGKSAWETANAWVGSGRPTVPADIRALLDSHEGTRGLVLARGEVEMKTHLHHRPPSGPRNHDLGLWSIDNTAFFGIESKADDGLKGMMLDQYEAAEKVLRKGRRTLLHHRVDWLSQCLLGHCLLQSDGARGSGFSSEIGGAVLRLPYQLFAGVAGTLLEARRCNASAAIFIVHQFRTRYTDDARIETDAALLDRFVSLLICRNPTKSEAKSQDPKFGWGCMVGPIYIGHRTCGECRWDMPATIPLYIGKALATCPF